VNIGKSIRDSREERGLTLRDLEARSGVAFQTISKYERGVRVPSLGSIERIAKGLGVKPEKLVAQA